MLIIFEVAIITGGCLMALLIHDFLRWVIK